MGRLAQGRRITPLLTAATVVAAAIAPTASGAGATSAPQPRIAAKWGTGARLGGRAPLRVSIAIPASRPPVADVRIFLPDGVDLASSKLGIAPCKVPARNFEDVIVGRVDGRSPCPRNAVLGTGAATAVVRMNPFDPPANGAGRLTLFNAVEDHGRPGIMIAVDTDRPMVSTFYYAGYLSTAPAPYGLRLRLRVRRPTPSPLFDADIALRRFAVTIGGPDISYSARRRGRTVYYRPGGLGLPVRCDRRRGFPFRIEVRYVDGRRGIGTVRTPCSPSV